MQKKSSHNLTVTVGSSTVESKFNELILTTENFSQVQTNCNLNQNTTLKIPSMVQSCNKTNRIVKRNLKLKLSEMSHSVNEFFNVKQFNFEQIQKDETTDLTENVSTVKI